MSFLAKQLIRKIGKTAARRFEAATHDPVGTQHRKLMGILEKNSDTEYGKEHNFGSLKNLKDYQRAVPVVNYNDIMERMERMVRGEKNILTAEAPVLFAQTSGTTGKAKYVPITPTCQGRDHSDQMRTWTYHAIKAHPNLLDGKIISMVSPAVEGHTEAGIPYGSTSGMIYKNMPSVVRRTYAIPYDVFEVTDYEAKYYSVMRFGVGCNVTWIGTANPSSIVKMSEKANEYAEDLIKDIADGTLKQGLDIDPGIRATLERELKADPKRARELEQMRSRRDGKLLPVDYWPNLALIGCWKGGTVGSYLERFPDWFDPDTKGMPPIRDWGYLSSEARGSIPLSDEGAGGILTVATNVYEFVPEDEVEENPDDSRTWNFLGVDEVEQDKQYYIFFTTTGGLYRYDINDVVEVVDFYNKTPVIVFRRKGRGMTSITGEKLSVNQVMYAFATASHASNLRIDHFKAEADHKNARYVFKVEISAGLTEEQGKQLLKKLDEELSTLNIEYDAKRKSQRLNEPVLYLMNPGWYDNLKKKLISEGKRLFQAKTILLDARTEDATEEDIQAVINMY